MSEIMIPTPEQIRTTFDNVRQTIASKHLCLDATIDDYPIGRRERGKCRLQGERGKQGYRTVRTTTNKAGRWCAPKKSTYTGSIVVVVRDWDSEHQHVWLRCGDPGSSVNYTDPHVSIIYANGAYSTLAHCWRSDEPRREEKRLTWTKTSFRLYSGEAPEVETEEQVLPADSPEEIAAWDVWAEELKTVRQMLLDVWARSIAAA
jgi:hypothetical protein